MLRRLWLVLTLVLAAAGCSGPEGEPPAALAPGPSSPGLLVVSREGSLVRLDHGGQQPVVLTTGFDDAQPAFRPDGTQLTFSRRSLAAPRQTDGQADLYRVGTDGGNPINLTATFPYDALEPSYSGDGQRIVFSARVGADDHDLYVMNADGSGRTALTRGPQQDRHPAFLEGASAVVFQRGTSIYRVPVTGGEAVAVAEGTSPTVAGGQLLFLRHGQVWTLQGPLTRGGEGEHIRITGSPEHDIVFTLAGPPGSGTGELHVMRSDGSGMRRLTTGLGASDVAAGPVQARSPAADPPPAPELGVNFNGVWTNIELDDLSRTGTTWIRGFIDYNEWRSSSPSSPPAGLAQLQAARAQGYKVLINIKFNYEDPAKFPFPTTPEKIDADLAHLDTLLGYVYPACDILVIGNEPLIETPKEYRGAPYLLNFYSKAAQAVEDYRAQHPPAIPLYLGAYDNLWFSEAHADWRGWARPLLEFTHKTPWLAGADLHIHQTRDVDINEAFAFVEGFLREDQTILVSEFSQVNYYLEHNLDPIPEILHAVYGRPPPSGPLSGVAGWQVWNYLDYTLRNPVSLQEWSDFLSHSPWYMAQADYLNVAWARFQARPKFLVASYGMYQTGPASFTPSDQPWILNALFVNQTVQPGSDGRPALNIPVGNQFRALHGLPPE